ncbi:hypothetical protein WJ07_14285 [Burkholderia vietnamiensis]|nr:hypothetical protein WJ07_14285 [Burkholderia vietnamiensis]KVF66331.1 hypothetical protein WJ17_18115 [Burkholderia vietnamiensis]
MVMESTPATSFEVAPTEFLLEIVIVPLDTPAHFGDMNHTFERGVRRQSRKPIFERLRITFGPFDQQPFLIAQCGAPVIAV